MFIRHSLDQAGVRPGPALLHTDLCAQLAPLNRYGLAGLSVALANGVRALIGAARRIPAARECCARC
jgi:hypothetical protein